METRTEIELIKIGKMLGDKIKKKGINAQNIHYNSELNKQQVYAVLRMGKSFRPNYSIETFIKVLKAIGVRLDFKDIED